MAAERDEGAGLLGVWEQARRREALLLSLFLFPSSYSLKRRIGQGETRAAGTDHRRKLHRELCVRERNAMRLAIFSLSLSSFLFFAPCPQSNNPK